ncbi:SDR family NAD(P)-dependent oxidoreductase [Streptomyces halobius]|uniref:SDR family NAD(P)-dependent oxidoreductase n=1 Tax=Streptomyces halobius TaxID=2879846 RepID=A0ABY4M6H9_9ACTN|nr:SDR family NAD(P)-dependent oxidoreductase [Streptomyces halobius]UQA91990.1 SDR family NAD(P)-dependent oxidoreductase [Streptomyces halobius]
MTTALVTGASYGIGHEIAHELAARGYDLILVARSADALYDLAHDVESRYTVSTTVLPANLAAPGELELVANSAGAIDILVNNAGAALAAPFTSTAWEGQKATEKAMLALNVSAPTRLIHAALPQMMRRGFGRVLNIGSVSGTAPVWASSTYGPSKAYLLALTQSISRSREIRASNVRLTCLVLGHTVSEFHKRAGIPPSPRVITLPARFIANAAVRAIHRPSPPVTYVPSIRYKFLNSLVKYAPQVLTMAPGLVTDFTAAGGEQHQSCARDADFRAS